MESYNFATQNWSECTFINSNTEKKLFLLTKSGTLGPPSFHFLDFEAGSSKRNTNADAVELHIQFKHASDETEEILGSCNGLMIFLKFGKLNARSGINLLMWNPSTGDCKLIPNPTPLFGYHDLLEFGYDSYLDDYKIVRIVKRLDHQKNLEFIYIQ